MADEDGRTGFEWMDATFGWLTSRFNSVRLLATLWGVVGAANLVGNLEIYFSGPPRLDTPFMPLYRHGVAFCWLDPDPSVGLLFSIALLLPSISGMVLVWFRPRIGFLASAVGWVSFWGSPFFHSHDPGDRPRFGWGWVACLGFVLLLFLAAAVRVGRSGAEEDAPARFGGFEG
jgi:hypothetical protein